MSHPLEGNYIIYRYTEQDTEDEGSTLCLYRLKRNNLNVVYHPGLTCDPSYFEIRDTNGELMKVMKRLHINEVYTVFHTQEFFGVPGEWFPTSEYRNENDEYDQWAEYKSLCREDYEARLFTDNGIRLFFYDEDRKKLIGELNGR